MLKPLQKYAPVISIFLLIILVITLASSVPIASSISIMILGLGAAIISTMHSNWETKENDELTNTQFGRNTFIDLLGFALVMLSAMWLGRMAGGYAGQRIGG